MITDKTFITEDVIDAIITLIKDHDVEGFNVEAESEEWRPELAEDGVKYYRPTGIVTTTIISRIKK